METLNMMSKYHIVYQKMETVLANWTNTLNSKNELESKRRAFNLLKLKSKIQKRAVQMR